MNITLHVIKSNNFQSSIIDIRYTKPLNSKMCRVLIRPSSAGPRYYKMRFNKPCTAWCWLHSKPRTVAVDMFYASNMCWVWRIIIDSFHISSILSSQNFLLCVICSCFSCRDQNWPDSTLTHCHFYSCLRIYSYSKQWYWNIRIY